MSKTQDFTDGFTHNGTESINGEKLIYPAATRNQEPILQVLKRFIICDEENISDESPLFLEVSSGSGQHLYHFAPHFPGVRFQPTEYDKSLLGSITYYSQACPTKNIYAPIQLDICNDFKDYGLQENSIDYLYNANMIHITPYQCTLGLFKNAGCYLKPDALMIMYGPYCKDGIISPQSNIDFDAFLKSRDPSWGLRDINDLIKLAEENDLSLIDTIEMPANNKILIWKKNLNT
ncbi:UPF0585 protein CG18661 [Plodia interpunctella]|uniref:UPF0585 protein CG18661 n=1 Tax=Plodia interpunctella TaxID=58824 RepID=UPI00236799CF|nr:UPF0585 protein CG18661 [Plodia interpunctella]